MRVLVVHSRYSTATPSGENTSVDTEVAALRAAGAEVLTVLPTTPARQQATSRQKAELAARGILGLAVDQDLRSVARHFRPDVLHYHNLFPSVPLRSVGAAAEDVRAAVVTTVRNYRYTCLPGTHWRDGRRCLDCRPYERALPGVQHACYSSSRAQSAVLAAVLRSKAARLGLPDVFVCISEHVRHYVIGLGVPAEKTRTIANSSAARLVSRPGTGLLFAGRLEEEKGVQLLLDAWGSLGTGPHRPSSLIIAGNGKLRHVVERAADQDPSLRYVGDLDQRSLDAAYAAAGAVVVPSLWDEPFGRVVVEAFAAGKQVLATPFGGLAELVDDEVGEVVQPTTEGLACAMVTAFEPGVARRRGMAALHRWSASYSPEVQARLLLEVYAEVAR
jgi:glycosyltransferase involved in cell wall biosynthesis